MDPVFKKLNFKNQKEILVLNFPESFKENMDGMKRYTTFSYKLQEVKEIEFVIVFVTKKDEVDRIVPPITKKIVGDAHIWFCYPKGSSKKYKCDFNRDTGWGIMGTHGLEPVRLVAIDEDWSALRFRKVAFIKKITRRESFALTEEAKKRTTKKGE